MHVLFVHQNFPAQFRCVAPRLAADCGWDCTFVTANDAAPDLPGVRRVVYPRPVAPDATPLTRRFHENVGHAHAVYAALKARPEVRPDLVVAHSGFGSSLFLPQLYDAPVVNFFEFFYRPVGQDLGYRPELPLTERSLLYCRVHNAMILLDLENCDRGWCPNSSQREAFPPEFHGKIDVMPEGVDTDLYAWRPKARGRRLPDGTWIDDRTRVVTYVSRGLELQRGFDVFLRAARRVYEQVPDVLFVVVGRDRAFYGGDRKLTGDVSLREALFATGEFDPARFHFTGYLPERELAGVLAIGDLHVYLTVPFVTSWSLLDAMSCGCVVLASDQACTREYVTHGRNGLLADFFDVEALAARAVEVLRDPAAYRPLGDAARDTIEQHYSLRACLPRLKAYFERVAAAKREPSARVDKLARPGTGLPVRIAPRTRLADPSPAPFDGSLPYFAQGANAGAAPARRPARARGGGGKTILFAWELGGGLGHLMQILPLAEDLARDGHRVWVALKDLTRAADVLGRAGVSFLQAPAPAGPVRIPRPLGYAQLLLNVGFAGDKELFARACAWRNLFRMTRPDLIVAEHAPTALLASRGLSVRRALLGPGFYCPPDEPDDGRLWGQLRPLPAGARLDTLRAQEASLLAGINRLLENWKAPPLERLGRFYEGVDENFLTTLPELDPFPRRGGAGTGARPSPRPRARRRGGPTGRASGCSRTSSSSPAPRACWKSWRTAGARPWRTSKGGGGARRGRPRRRCAWPGRGSTRRRRAGSATWRCSTAGTG
jgi:glycosyltransferase involved in cell wall biosynthesis